MRDSVRTYLINRLEVLEQEIGIKEKEYRRIVRMLTEKEESMKIECGKCKRERDESEFYKHKNGIHYVCCRYCVDRQRNRQQQYKVFEEEPKVEKKKKVNFGKEIKKIAKTGMSYKEYQMQETLRLAGMKQRKKEV